MGFKPSGVLRVSLDSGGICECTPAQCTAIYESSKPWSKLPAGTEVVVKSIAGAGVVRGYSRGAVCVEIDSVYRWFDGSDVIPVQMLL